MLLQEIVIQKQPGEKLGISIRGGAKGHAGNPFDPTDEGIFISKVLKLVPRLCNSLLKYTDLQLYLTSSYSIVQNSIYIIALLDDKDYSFV